MSPSLCKSYLTKKERDGVLRQMTWPPHKPSWVGLGWDEAQSEGKRANKCQHLWEVLRDCWKTISGDYLMKIIERVLRVCKAVIKAKGCYLKNLKYKTCFELFHTFLFTKKFHMCSVIVLMPSVRIYNVHSHENKEMPLSEKVCPNFWLVVYVSWNIFSHSFSCSVSC